MPRSVGILVDLDTSERASSDCKTCKTRRVRCDRAIPACRKCRDRLLECPGYPSGKPLRWKNGIAEKGRLTGQHLLIERSEIGSTSSLYSSLPIADDQKVDKATSQADFLLSSPLNIDSLSQATFLPLEVNSSSGSMVQSHTTRYLLHHYSSILSSKLPWIDSFHNPWRSIILPMAMDSPSILFSILSMAAEDLELKLRHTAVPNSFSRISHIYRGKAIELVASDMAQYLTIHGDSFSNPKATTMVLAATLILCNLEIRQTHSTTWRLHLRAAQAIIQCWETTSHSLTSVSTTNFFLIEKFFSLNVFALMSTFEDTEDILTHGLNYQCNSVFLEFLQIMQDITVGQRREGLDECAEGRDNEKCQQLHHQFEVARQTARTCSEALIAHSVTSIIDLENIVDMFHHAGLIYSHQVLALQCCAEAMPQWRNGILLKFDLLNEVDRFCQNLLWPLFIAGTQSCGDKDSQKAVNARVRQVVALSGHWNGLRLLDFLNELWKLDGRPQELHWRHLARDWVKRGNGFIVI